MGSFSILIFFNNFVGFWRTVDDDCVLAVVVEPIRSVVFVDVLLAFTLRRFFIRFAFLAILWASI